MTRPPVVRISDVASIVGGGTPTRSNPAFFDGPIPWVTPKDMKSWQITKSQIGLTQAGLDQSAARLIPANSVLIVVRSGVLKHSLPVGVNRVPVAINQDMKALMCDSRVHPDFLAHFIRAHAPTILQWVRATTADNFPIDKLKELPVDLPPLVDQRRIAEILDRADALRSKRREALAKLDALTHSIFLEMFGDPILNPKGWPLESLDSLGQFGRGVSRHRPRNDPDLLGGPYPFVQTGDIANCDGYLRTFGATYSEVGLRQSKMWPAGTLCITIAANIAKTAVLTFDACFPDSVVGFTSTSDATVEFVRHWLTFLQPYLERSAPESAQKNINLDTLRGLRVPTPPIDEQCEFHRRIRAIERLRLLQVRDSYSFDALFTSLQHRAFRGEL